MSARGDHLNWPFAALWTSGMLAAWLISCSVQPWGSRWAVPLIVLACGFQAVAMWLRLPSWKNLPIPRGWTNVYWPEATGTIDTELTWLLAWTSQLYFLAGVAQLTGKLWPALIALVLVVISELWLWRFAPEAWRARLSQQLARLPATALALDTPIDQETSLDTIRSQAQGQLADGETYQSGWVIVTLPDQQRSLAQTIVFSPPFLVAPEVELDYELLDDTRDQEQEVDFELTAEHLTPSGMRVSLKRKSTTGQARAKLLWHAIESQSEPLRRLP